MTQTKTDELQPYERGLTMRRRGLAEPSAGAQGSGEASAQAEIYELPEMRNDLLDWSALIPASVPGDATFLNATLRQMQGRGLKRLHQALGTPNVWDPVPITLQALKGHVEDAGLHGGGAAHAGTYAQLRGFSGARLAGVAEVFGYLAANDGWGGLYRWDGASAAADDEYLVLKPNSVASGSPGRWLRVNYPASDVPDLLAVDEFGGHVGIKNPSPTAVLHVGEGQQQAGHFAVEGHLVQVIHGTDASPYQDVKPTVKVTRTQRLTRAQLNAVSPRTDGADLCSAFVAVAKGVATDETQPVAVMGYARSESTTGTEGNDALALYGVGRHSGNGVAIGGFLIGRKDSPGAGATGAEIHASNYSGVDDSYVSGQWPKSKAIWMFADGDADSAAAIFVGNVRGNQYDVGIVFPEHAHPSGTFGACKTATFLDEGRAATSLLIKGQHATAAIAVASGAGPVLIGRQSRSLANSLFEAGGATPALAVFENAIGLFGSAGAAKQAVAGSRGGNAALASLLTALANYGAITNNTTA